MNVELLRLTGGGEAGAEPLAEVASGGGAAGAGAIATEPNAEVEPESRTVSVAESESEGPSVNGSSEGGVWAGNPGGGEAGVDEPIGCVPADGTRIGFPQLLHLDRLPACSSRVCNRKPHTGQLKSIVIAPHRVNKYG